MQTMTVFGAEIPVPARYTDGLGFAPDPAQHDTVPLAALDTDPAVDTLIAAHRWVRSPRPLWHNVGLMGLAVPVGVAADA